jgi:hypothetical protein
MAKPLGNWTIPHLLRHAHITSTVVGDEGHMDLTRAIAHRYGESAWVPNDGRKASVLGRSISCRTICPRYRYRRSSTSSVMSPATSIDRCGFLTMS